MLLDAPLTLGLGLTLSLLAGEGPPAPSGTDPAPAGLRSFGDQYVLLLSPEPAIDRAIYREASLRPMGPQTFLVGKRVSSSSSNPAPIEEWVSLARVARFSVYRTVDEARAELAKCSQPSQELPPLVISTTKKFQVQCPPDASDHSREVEAVRLYVSTDQGRSWALSTEVKPDERAVSYEASKDGPYWFASRVVLKGGQVSPGADEPIRPTFRVLVLTARNTSSNLHNEPRGAARDEL